VEPKKEAPLPQPFAEPETVGPRNLLGARPFPVALSADQKAHPGIERDYLAELGGESKAHIDATTRSRERGGAYARQAELNDKGTLDLVKLFGENTDNKVAYAYSEWTTDKQANPGLFGSDDAAVVWLNGIRSIGSWRTSHHSGQ